MTDAVKKQVRNRLIIKRNLHILPPQSRDSSGRKGVGGLAGNKLWGRSIFRCCPKKGPGSRVHHKFKLALYALIVFVDIVPGEENAFVSMKLNSVEPASQIFAGY